MGVPSSFGKAKELLDYKIGNKPIFESRRRVIPGCPTLLLTCSETIFKQHLWLALHLIVCLILIVYQGIRLFNHTFYTNYIKAKINSIFPLSNKRAPFDPQICEKPNISCDPPSVHRAVLPDGLAGALPDR